MDDNLSDEEYKRLQKRLKMRRYRKRKQALSEGKDPDFYITDEDYTDGYQGEPNQVSLSGDTSLPAGDQGGHEGESTPITKEGWIALSVVGVIVLGIFAVPIWIAKNAS